MDEETTIINKYTRNQKIKDFLINNKKILVSILTIIIILFMSYFALEEFNERKKIKISDQYNAIVEQYSNNNKENTKKKIN